MKMYVNIWVEAGLNLTRSTPEHVSAPPTLDPAPPTLDLVMDFMIRLRESVRVVQFAKKSRSFVQSCFR